jgi:hypothetical protein
LISTHALTLDAKTDNNRPYNRPYRFALPSDLSRYRYRRAPMYLRSFHVTDLTNTKRSNVPRQFWTSHILLRLPNIIPMIRSNRHIDNLEISATSKHRTHRSIFGLGFGPMNDPDILQFMVLVVLFDFAMFCFIFSLCSSFI